MKPDQFVNDNVESPIFIVGAPRSGTTMLSVTLDRHPNICIPPETQFFSQFLPSLPENGAVLKAEELVELALSSSRIKDLHLDKNKVLEVFLEMGKNGPLEYLLLAILKCYAQKEGKLRFGEKSPGHLNCLEHILSVFPKAKIICIVRDGRDVVRSLLEVGWAEPGNPRRFWLFCMQWEQSMRLSLKFNDKFSSESFFMVKYEDIILQPELEISKICKFLGEKFSLSQLSEVTASNVVPAWEKSWKGNATMPLDKSRIYAWRNTADKKQIWAMNCIMGKMLADAGYCDTSMKGCPLIARFKFNMVNILFFPILRPVTLLVLKMLRALKMTTS